MEPFTKLFRMRKLQFEKITDTTSKITIQTIYKSVDFRDQMLKLPFAQGINMAHNRLQEIIQKLVVSCKINNSLLAIDH